MKSSSIIPQLECHISSTQVLLVLSLVVWVVIISYPSLWEATHHSVCNLCGLFSIQRIYIVRSLSNINKRKSFVSIGILSVLSTEKLIQPCDFITYAIKGNLVAHITEKSRGRKCFGQDLIWQFGGVTKVYFFPFLHSTFHGVVFIRTWYQDVMSKNVVICFFF